MSLAEISELMLPGNLLYLSTNNSSDNLEDAFHPKNPIELSLYGGGTTLLLGRRHFNFPWHLRQGQHLGGISRTVFPQDCIARGPWYRYSLQPDAVSWIPIITHLTAWFQPRGTASCAPAMPGNMPQGIPVVGAPVTQP